MRRSKIVFISILLQLISILYIKGQIKSYTEQLGGIFNEQIGNVVFGSSLWDRDLPIKKKCAKLCLGYIAKYYPKKKLPNICLAISSREDSAEYKLAYDNLDGNSIDNEFYERKQREDEPGIRIVIYSKELSEIEVLKLLDYGINNLTRLKKIRRDALKQDDYHRPDNLSLSREEIDSVLKSPAKKEIVTFLDSNK